MSMRAMIWAWSTDTTATQKLVLLKLADNANEDGLCWPSRGHMADFTGLSESAIKSAIRAMEELGLVRIERRQGADGVNLSNVYHLSVPGQGGRGRQETKGGGRSCPGEGAPGNPYGAPGNPKSSIEPSNRTLREESPLPLEPEPEEEPEAPPPAIACGDTRCLKLKDRFPATSKLPKRGGKIAYPAEFEAAWEAYPVRPEDTKRDCYAHWQRAVVQDRVAPAVIVQGAEVWAFVWARQEMRFGFRRWLREALWNHTPPKPNGPKGIIGHLIEANGREHNDDPFNLNGPIPESAYVRPEIEH